MKIYIIGPTGSGKSTLANILSKKMNIKNYELDLLVYDDEHDHIKRSDEEIEKLFHNILKKTLGLLKMQEEINSLVEELKQIKFII